jgi:uncharacterized protein (TIGR00251 family)
MHAPGDPAPLPAFLTVQPDGVALAVKVTPRAPRDEIGEPLGGELRVKVTAPPVDAAANDALVRFLAEVFGCPRSAVHILRGQTARHKLVKLRGVSATAVLDRLQAGR